MAVALCFGLAWALWALSWALAARWSARTVASSETGATKANRIMLIGGAVLLFGGGYLWPQSTRLLILGDAAIAILAALLLAGFAFAWWARLHLGSLWSSGITRKDDHHVVDTGPYALVRHPIYTGLIAAVAATAGAVATPFALAGGALMIYGLWRKAVLEEPFLRQELGQAYDAYCRRVPMLVPFFPTGG
jgi:protein-S-isoprenylcysteine O-methyltransferase Ste14